MEMDTPLQLDEYFFPHVQVTADPQAGEPDDSNMEYNVVVSIVKDGNEKNHQYQVALQISSNPETEEKRQPYFIDIVAIGFFRVHPDWPDPEKLLNINGASILYSAAREFIITITARGPWGPEMLPAISFLKGHEDSSSKIVDPTPGEVNK